MPDIKTEFLVIEVSEQLIKIVDTMLVSGLWGPTREAVVQRLIEQKLWEMSLSMHLVAKEN